MKKQSADTSIPGYIVANVVRSPPRQQRNHLFVFNPETDRLERVRKTPLRRRKVPEASSKRTADSAATHSANRSMEDAGPAGAVGAADMGNNKLGLGGRGEESQPVRG